LGIESLTGLLDMTLRRDHSQRVLQEHLEACACGLETAMNQAEGEGRSAGLVGKIQLHVARIQLVRLGGVLEVDGS
jgi:hypothetical protein